jgi:hypothetical protein
MNPVLATVLAASDADRRSRLRLSRGEQSITLPSAANRRGGEESTQ